MLGSDEKKKHEVVVQNLPANCSHSKLFIPQRLTRASYISKQNAISGRIRDGSKGKIRPEYVCLYVCPKTEMIRVGNVDIW